MALLLKNVRAIDPQVSLDEVCDILIRDGKVVEVGQGLSIEKGETRDMTGKIAVPGLVDVHVHLREPGFEHKEDIATGTRAAAVGGFTGICAMANTKPVIDNVEGIEYIKRRAEEVGKCRIYPCGAVTKGLQGEELSDMQGMFDHGACAFSDDGRGVQRAGMMRRVMDCAAKYDRVVMAHEQDEDLVGKGQINEGVVSARLGLQGWPAEGEEVQISRDIALSRLTGCPLHVQHISTARGLDMIRAAKAEGLRVTCEATPHHLFLNEECIKEVTDTFYKVNPPLRTQADSDALLGGLLDGTVDCIVTDHAPHATEEKAQEFDKAPFGMTGIETSLALMLTQLVHTGVISYDLLVELMAINPRKILRLEEVRIAPGSVADITIFDPNLEWTVTADGFASKSINNGFIGAELKGRATDVYVGGYAALQDGKIVE